MESSLVATHKMQNRINPGGFKQVYCITASIKANSTVSV